MGPPVNGRVILHIDVDCFYAQVEESRRPELKGRPLGIYQKFLVVTCNYPARTAGVAKMCSKEDALRVCPELVLVNGEDLTPYRAVSKRILEVMRRFGIVERRGMDEAYLDITAEVRKRMSLAAGPSPVYKGFVGKVLAGSSESKRVVAESPKNQQKDRNPSPPDQLVAELDTTPPSKLLINEQNPEDKEIWDASKGAASEEDTKEAGNNPPGASEGISKGHISREERHLGEQKMGCNDGGEEPSTKRRKLLMLEAEENQSPCERAHETLGGERSRFSVSESDCEKYVPPGWRPLMRAKAGDDVSKAEKGRDDIFGFGGHEVVPTIASEAGGSAERQNEERFGREAGERVGRPGTPEPAEARTQPKHSSLAEAFGGVLNRPQQQPPSKVNTKSESGISWLDWRNEADPGLPLGEASPDHFSPGKSSSGKLPGHWSDVRQVRFQPAAPEGLLKTTERLDLSADVAASDWLLLVGSHVSAEVREAIWAEVGCRCSAGIAHNKMLAKLASPMNKPNGQTTLLSKGVAEHIKDLAARKIPGIGWSYDAKLRDMKIDSIGDLQKLPLSLLEEKFGARVGSMIFNCCRGNDTSLVEDKGPPKSLSVEDSFRACLNLKQAEGIVKALAPDYIDRLDEEREDTGRRPKTLTVKWRQKKASYQGQSTSGPMPLDIVTSSLPKPRREEALVRSTMGLLSKLFFGKQFHFVKLNVGATNFVEETAKGTSSLLQSWAGKAERKDVLVTQKAGTKDDSMLHRPETKDVPVSQEAGVGEAKVEREGDMGGLGADAANGVADTSLTIATQRLTREVPFVERNGQEPETFTKTSEPISDAQRVGVLRRKAPEAVAGSVLHANTGSKKDARAMREALEGIQPVLGNGHLESTKRPEELDLEWDLDRGVFAQQNESREESEGEEDLWEDLKAVQRERHFGRAVSPKRTSEGDFGLSKQFLEGGDDRKKGSGLEALWKQSLSPSKLAKSGEVAGRSFEDLKDCAQETRRKLAEIEGTTACTAFGNASAKRLDATDGELAIAPLQPNRLSDLQSDRTGVCKVSEVVDDKKGTCSASRKCSLCGEVLPADPIACQDHRDLHLAMKLQAEEEKIGRLFKAASSRVGSLKVLPSQGKRPIAGSGPKKGKHTIDALWKRL